MLLLAACQGGTEYGWWKPGFTESALVDDARLCTEFAAAAVARFPARDLRDVTTKAALRSRLAASCLRSKGWRWVEMRDGKPLDLGPGPAVDL